MGVMYLRFLTVLSVFFIIFAIFSLWLARDIYDTSNFTALSVKAFEDPEVRAAIASETVDRALQDRPIIRQVAGDYLESFVAGMLANERMKNLFERTAERLHDYVLNNNKQDITLETGAIGSAIKPIISLVSPNLSEQLTNDIPSSVTLLNSNAFPNINKWVGWIVATGPILGLIGLVLLIVVYFYEKNLKLSLKRTGIYLAIGSIVFMLIVPYFRLLLSSRVTNQNRTTIVLTTYDTFTRNLLEYLLIAALIAAGLYALGYFWPQIRKFASRMNK
jgi:hypothetical protein